jgi:hypothetical protein
MIFDDLENDEMAPGTLNHSKASAKSLEFETSLDELLLNKQANECLGEYSLPLYEVFQIQFNERFFTIPRIGKDIVERVQSMCEHEVDREGFELRVKGDRLLPEELSKMSFGLSQAGNEEERINNLKAMESDSFDSDSSDSSKISKEATNTKQHDRAKEGRASRRADSKPPVERLPEKARISNCSLPKSSRRISKMKERLLLERTPHVNHCNSNQELGKSRHGAGLLLKKHFSMCSFGINGNPDHIDDEYLDSLVSLDFMGDKKHSEVNFAEEKCLLCRKSYFFKDLVARVLGCGHHFHKSCLEAAFEEMKASSEKALCPGCKHN